MAVYVFCEWFFLGIFMSLCVLLSKQAQTADEKAACVTVARWQSSDPTAACSKVILEDTVILEVRDTIVILNWETILP